MKSKTKKMVTILLKYRSTNYHLKRSQQDKNKLNSIVAISSVGNTLYNGPHLFGEIHMSSTIFYVIYFQSVGLTLSVKKVFLLGLFKIVIETNQSYFDNSRTEPILQTQFTN